MKKLILAILPLALLAVAISGCGAPAEPAVAAPKGAPADGKEPSKSDVDSAAATTD